RFGSRSDNAGIVAFDVRRAPGGGLQGFVAVRNFAPAPRRCTLELYRDDQPFDARALSLPPASLETGCAEQALTLDALPPGTGILRARIDSQDDLDVDNQAFTQVAP